MIPKNRIPTHPGEILLEEFLEPMDISQMRLAAHIEVPVQRVNELINAKRGITPETAWKLAGAFGTTPEFWTNLQAAHDLAQGRPPEPPGLVDPLWELRRGVEAVLDAAQNAVGSSERASKFEGMPQTWLEGTPDGVRYGLEASGHKTTPYENAPCEIAGALVAKLRHDLPSAILKNPAVKEALEALRRIEVQPRKLNTVENLIARAGDIRKVRIWRQPAVGVSSSLAAARTMAEGRGRNPWIGAAPGFTVSLSATQYDELKRRGAVEEEPHV